MYINHTVESTCALKYIYLKGFIGWKYSSCTFPYPFHTLHMYPQAKYKYSKSTKTNTIVEANNGRGRRMETSNRTVHAPVRWHIVAVHLANRCQFLPLVLAITLAESVARIFKAWFFLFTRGIGFIYIILCHL